MASHPSSRGARPSGGRPRHIGDIVHHFLTDVPREPADPGITAWVVTGPTAGTTAARVAAELERRLARDPGEGPSCWQPGAASPSLLADLEALRRVPGGCLPCDGQATGLVWCLGPADAAAWAPLATLGRLARLLQPCLVAVICTAAGEVPATPTVLADLAGRVEAVCGHGPPVQVLPGDGSTGDLVAAIYANRHSHAARPAVTARQGAI